MTYQKLLWIRFRLYMWVAAKLIKLAIWLEYSAKMFRIWTIDTSKFSSEDKLSFLNILQNNK